MKRYVGYRVDGQCAVDVHCEALVTRGRLPGSRCIVAQQYGSVKYCLRSVREFSPGTLLPVGFDWGNRHRKSANLAAALLQDALPAETISLAARAGFHLEMIATLETANWEMSDTEIIDWYRQWQESGRSAAAERAMAAAG